MVLRFVVLAKAVAKLRRITQLRIGTWPGNPRTAPALLMEAYTARPDVVPLRSSRRELGSRGDAPRSALHIGQTPHEGAVARAVGIVCRWSPSKKESSPSDSSRKGANLGRIGRCRMAAGGGAVFVVLAGRQSRLPGEAFGVSVRPTHLDRRASVSAGA